MQVLADSAQHTLGFGASVAASALTPPSPSPAPAAASSDPLAASLVDASPEVVELALVPQAPRARALPQRGSADRKERGRGMGAFQERVWRPRQANHPPESFRVKSLPERAPRGARPPRGDRAPAGACRSR